MTLKWTGERFLPWMVEETGQIHYEHIHRYAFASMFTKGKRILDLACGEGYGSYMLSKEAKHVIGVDIDINAIEHAQNKYIMQNLEFIHSSILDIPIKNDEKFDVIVCFEAIEHVDEQGKLLFEVKRLLNENGIFIVSTPNKLIYTDERENFNNPFHKKELYFDEFQELLGEYFKYFVFFGQKIYGTSNIWPLPPYEYSGTREFVIEKKNNEFFFSEINKKVPEYLIVIASDKKININEVSISTQLIDASNNLLNFFEKQVKTLVEREKLVAELNYSLSIKETTIRNLETHNKNLELYNRNLEAHNKNLETHNRNLETYNRNLETYNTNLETHSKYLEISLKSLEDNLKQSIIWQTILKFQRFVEKIMPQGTRRRRGYDLVLRTIRVVLNQGFKTSWLKFINSKKKIDIEYNTWILQNEPKKKDLKKINNECKTFIYKPKISIAIPVWNTDNKVLISTIESVRKQIYDNWELCIADGDSTKPNVRMVLQKYLEKDHRIKVKFLDENKGIAMNSNEALSLASGEFIGLLDHDDELSPFALYEVVKLLNKYPDANLIYSDEDRLDEHGKRIAPFFKPSWSLPMLLSTNYPCHFLLYRHSLIREVCGFRKGFDGSQDYDLVLRVLEKISKESIHHIPKILYHWRITPLSAASGREAKPYAYAAGKKAIEEYLLRNNIEGEVIELKDAGSYRVKKKVKNTPSIDIIIVSDDFNGYNYSIDRLQKNFNEMISTTKNKPSNIFIPSNMNIQEAKKYSHLSNEQLNEIIENDNPDHIIFIESSSLINESFIETNSDWIEPLIEHFSYFNVGLVGTGTFIFGNIIHNVDRTCGKIFCLSRNLLKVYLENNNVPSDFDDLQIALADYSVSLGYDNLFTPHSVGNQFDITKIKKYFLTYNKNNFYTNNMKYYLPRLNYEPNLRKILGFNQIY